GDTEVDAHRVEGLFDRCRVPRDVVFPPRRAERVGIGAESPGQLREEHCVRRRREVVDQRAEEVENDWSRFHLATMHVRRVTAPILMTYAIVKLGGKQYRVQEGDKLLVDRLALDESTTFHPEVLFFGGDGNAELAPKGVQVTAKVVGHVLGEK